MATQIFIVSGTTQVSPADWDNSNNTVEGLGGGGSGGATRGNTSDRVSAAGGGEWRKINNFPVATPGTTAFTYTIGPGGAQVVQSATGRSSGNDGTQTTFNTSSLVAKPGIKGIAAASGGSCSGGLGGTGGTGAGGNFDGGRGGNCTHDGSATGGGGAAGSTGAGNAGVDSAATNTAYNGGSADSGVGGAAGTVGAGRDGGAGTEWDGTHGSGGGGAGDVVTGGAIAAKGGAGGAYGGGGGSADKQNASASATARAGGDGIIVLTYTPLVVIAGWMPGPASRRNPIIVYERDLDVDIDPPSPPIVSRAPQVFSEVRRPARMRMSPAVFFQPMGNVPTAATPQGWMGLPVTLRSRALVVERDMDADIDPPAPAAIVRTGWDGVSPPIRRRPWVKDLAETSDASTPALQFNPPRDQWEAKPWPKAKVASGYEQSLFAIVVVVTAYSWGEQQLTPVTIKPITRGFASDIPSGFGNTVPAGFTGNFTDPIFRRRLPLMADGWQPMDNVPTPATPQGWWPQGWKETRVPRWTIPTQLEWLYEATVAIVTTYPDGWRGDQPPGRVRALRIGPSGEAVGSLARDTFMAWDVAPGTRLAPLRPSTAPVDPFPPVVPQGWAAWGDGKTVIIRRRAGFEAFGQPAAPFAWGWSGEFPSLLIRARKPVPAPEVITAQAQTVWVASFHDVRLIARTLSKDHPIQPIITARAADLGWDWREPRVRKPRPPMARADYIDTKLQPFLQAPFGYWGEHKWTFHPPRHQPDVNEALWLRTGFPIFARPTLLGQKKQAGLSGADTNASLDGKKTVPGLDGDKSQASLEGQDRDADLDGSLGDI